MSTQPPGFGDTAPMPPLRAHRRLTPIAFALLLAALSPLAAGQVYRWVDKQGRVHYGDRPPANAAPAKIRTIPVPVEPTAIARLRIEPGDGEYLAYADNSLAGPIEVMLALAGGSKVRGAITRISLAPRICRA